MKTINNTTVCDNCGHKGARSLRATRSYGKGASLLVIENVPIISCPRCGESYVTAETLHKIDQLKRQRKTKAVKRAVLVAALR